MGDVSERKPISTEKISGDEIEVLTLAEGKPQAADVRTRRVTDHKGDSPEEVCEYCASFIHTNPLVESITTGVCGHSMHLQCLFELLKLRRKIHRCKKCQQANAFVSFDDEDSDEYHSSDDKCPLCKRLFTYYLSGESEDGKGVDKAEIESFVRDP